MSFCLYTEVTINAPPSIVWSVLIDTTKYPEWNPFIKSLHPVHPNIHSIKLGQDIQLECYKQPHSNSNIDGEHKTQSFQANISKFLPNKEIGWKGQIVSPLLFEGEHSLELQTKTILLGSEREQDKNECTHVIHQELFRGLFVLIAKTNLNTLTRSNFIAMNTALKRRAEEVHWG